MHNEWIDDELTDEKKVIRIMNNLKYQYSANEITFEEFEKQLEKNNQKYGTAIKIKNKKLFKLKYGHRNRN